MDEPQVVSKTFDKKWSPSWGLIPGTKGHFMINQDLLGFAAVSLRFLRPSSMRRT